MALNLLYISLREIWRKVEEQEMLPGEQRKRNKLINAPI
jgi:hypothetical protein